MIINIFITYHYYYYYYYYYYYQHCYMKLPKIMTFSCSARH